MKPHWPCRVVLSVLVAVANASYAEEDGITAADLIELDFEDLVNMDVEIESAGKSTARAMDLPYAATVITAADIRQSGAQTIPDALRLAPGLSVNQISSGEWAVGIRGGGGRFSRYVLIIVDGRIAYNSVYSGVNWDELNLPLAQIARIEVIRGPNAAAWGANAVNGIINIISEKSRTEGANQIDAWGGSGDRAGVSASASAGIGDEWVVGVSGHAAQWQGLKTHQTHIREPSHKDWRMRASLTRTAGREETQFLVDAFGVKQAPSWSWINQDLSYQEAVNDEDKIGWWVQGSHIGTLGEKASWKIRASADRTERDTVLYQWDATNYQLDLEVAGQWQRHNFAVGFNSRYNSSSLLLEDFIDIEFRPAEREISHYGVYVSDVIALSESLQLTLAARMDNNELSNSNLQPSVRMIWSPAENDRLWFAASEATTTPARALVDIYDVLYTAIPPEESGAPLPVAILLNGYEELKEDPRLQAIEIGYRHTFENFNVDLAIFDFDYSNDVSIELLGDPELQFDRHYQPTHFIQRGAFANVRNFASRGGEISMRGKMSEWWTAQFSYSRVERVDGDFGWSSNTSIINNIQLGNDWQWNIWLRQSHGNADAAAQFSELNSTFVAGDDYVVVDTNLQWQASERWRLELIANNLGDEHVESQREEFETELMLVEAYVMLKVGLTF